MKKVMLIFGTRPEAIKMCPVVKEIAKDPDLKPIVCVTAQHREMLDQVLHLFQVQPDYDLNIMKDRQTLYDITARVLIGLAPVLAEVKPDLVLVHGDTTTTFAGALAAYYAQIPVGHVEAGLRTNNKYNPFPEEMNRRLTGAICEWHFAPTKLAKENLLKENVAADKIVVTGNTVIDALKMTAKDNYVFDDKDLQKALQSGKRLIVMTTHRRENLGEPLRQVYKALKAVLTTHEDTMVVFPVHKNPAVRSVVNEELAGLDRVILTEPLDYEPFANLMNHAYLILTDSGGIQEEAPSLGKPVLVVRNTTERPEAVTAGTVKLVGTDYAKVHDEMTKLLDDKEYYRSMAEAVNPYGDGLASQRIVQKIRQIFSLSTDKLVEFI
ncbi:MAG: UDP-N-acetylglucosamine 2-epimerase (non-hydrolyzing) [Phascolarctobacterium sp.]|nr:UDP-N-acetylglucosamine 2-epimerase (non-hydrolyzing) [Candidatus Phascolarctobacterium equi]